MAEGDEPQPDAWTRHRLERVRSVARATPERRIAWLEKALRLAERSGAMARARRRKEEDLRARWE